MSPHDAHAIPWRELVVPQITNFVIFVSALAILLRKPLRQHFSGKSEVFEEQRRKADEARRQAEAKNEEVRKLLKELEETAEKSIATARTEANVLKAELVNEAKEIAARVTDEAGKIVVFERERAVASLRAELIMNSTRLAEKELETATGEKVLGALNDDFIQKVQQGARA